MSGLQKKHAAVAAFSLVCFLGGTFAGNSLVEKAQDACRAEHRNSNLSEEFFRSESALTLCPDIAKNAIYMALMGFGSGVSGLVIGAAIAGRKKKEMNDPAP